MCWMEVNERIRDLFWCLCQNSYGGCEENLNGNYVIVRAKIRTRDFRTQRSVNHRTVTFGKVIYVVINTTYLQSGCKVMIMHRRDKSSAFAQQILHSNNGCPKEICPKLRTNIEVLWSCTSHCNYFFAITRLIQKVSTVSL